MPYDSTQNVVGPTSISSVLRMTNEPTSVIITKRCRSSVRSSDGCQPILIVVGRRQEVAAASGSDTSHLSKGVVHDSRHFTSVVYDVRHLPLTTAGIGELRATADVVDICH